jgi:hypothetical protein
MSTCRVRSREVEAEVETKVETKVGRYRGILHHGRELLGTFKLNSTMAQIQFETLHHSDLFTWIGDSVSRPRFEKLKVSVWPTAHASE